MIGLGLDTAADTSHPALFGGLPAETQNYSVYLDGASDRIQAANLATTWLQVFTANNPFSLHFAVKLDTLNMTISFTGSSTNYIWLQVSAGGDLLLQYGINSTLSGNETWDTNLSTGRDVKCYVNKVEKTATSGNAMAKTDNPAGISGKFTMGTFMNIVDYDLRIDRLASWSGVLSSAEITEIYDNYPDLTADSGDYASSNKLQTYYKMEEGSGTTMADSSGNSNASLSVVNASGNFWSSDTRI